MAKFRAAIIYYASPCSAGVVAVDLFENNPELCFAHNLYVPAKQLALCFITGRASRLAINSSTFIQLIILYTKLSSIADNAFT